LSEAAVSYDFEQLEPSAPPPRDAPARLLAQAQAEAGEIREHARAEGHAEGLAAGRAEGAEELRQALDALAEVLASIETLRQQLAENVERDAIDLALALAGKILTATLEVRPEAVVDVVQGALRRVAGARGLSILVHPGDLEVVQAALGELGPRAGSIAPIDVQADQRVPRGGALVRTTEGEIDVRVATQLERAREVALSELRGGTPSA
jgi:flagellar assembly protein FliH